MDESCSGCEKTNGHPCGGGQCVAAECARAGGLEALLACKKQIIEEVNELGVPELKISSLNLLNRAFVNLEYTLPNGHHVKLLEDRNGYWGDQAKRMGIQRCYGIVADENYLLFCEYECKGAEPEIVVYKQVGP